MKQEPLKRRRPAARKRGRKQTLRAVVLSVLTVSVIALCLGIWTKLPGKDVPVGGIAPPEDALSPASSVVTPEPEPEPQPVVETIRFSATGDNLIHAPIYKQAARRAGGDGTYSFDYCYEPIAPFYAEQDVNWINQETLCTDELEPSSYPCFSTPGDCARALYRAGVRVFSLSNNHTYDKGASGIAATLRFWGSMPEDVVTTGLWKGESDYGRIPMQTVNGVIIAYLSYTEHTNGIPQSKAMTANIIYTSQTDVIEQQVSAPAGRFCSGGCTLGRGKQSYRCGCAACIGTKPCGLGRGSDRRYASTCIAERSMADCSRWQKGIHRLFPGKFCFHTGCRKQHGRCDPDL